jgi:hypothetical protein
MATKEDLPLFWAAVKNSREISAAVNIFRQRGNSVLLKESPHELRVHTKLYALLFCVWAEAELLRLVYTPYGFSSGEIAEILKQDTVESKWKKMLEIGFGRTKLDPNGSLRQRYEPKLTRMIENYIAAPAQLRNKLAHGQWIDAFNSSSTRLNSATTSTLSNLDVVEVERWHLVFKQLSKIIEDSIESPTRALRRDIWGRVDEVENGINKMKLWTVHTKRSALQAKRMRTGFKSS